MSNFNIGRCSIQIGHNMWNTKQIAYEKRRYKPSLRTEENLSGQKIIQGINTDYLFNPLTFSLS